MSPVHIIDNGKKNICRREGDCTILLRNGMKGVKVLCYGALQRRGGLENGQFGVTQRISCSLALSL